jgi:hypothetical protein
MCTRTKTSYGCGCRHKSTKECHSQSCTGLFRYHFVKEYDCDECRRGGDLVTRGREGKGRYARELKLSNAPSPVTRPPLSPISTNIKASPWAQEPPRPREKEWRSPVRRKADDAWLVEHERREQDLEAKSKESSSGGSVSSPTTDYARDHRRCDENPAKLLDEMRRLKEELERLQARRRPERSNSYDSFNTMDNCRSPPRGRSFDSGFYVLPSPFIPKVTSHHGLGRGLGNIIRDSTRPRSKW